MSTRVSSAYARDATSRSRIAELCVATLERKIILLKEHRNDPGGPPQICLPGAGRAVARRGWRCSGRATGRARARPIQRCSPALPAVACARTPSTPSPDSLQAQWQPHLPALLAPAMCGEHRRRTCCRGHHRHAGSARARAAKTTGLAVGMAEHGWVMRGKHCGPCSSCTPCAAALHPSCALRRKWCRSSK